MKREYQPIFVLTEESQARRERHGRLYRKAADTVTYGRTILGLVGAGVILAGNSAPVLPEAAQYRSVGLCAFMGLMGFLDRADGVLARKSKKNGIPITDHDKKKDPFQDKIFAHVLMGSLALRAVVDGDWKYGAVIAASQFVTAGRDLLMNKSRENAVPGARVDAISINKYKTGVQNVAHTIATSPLANNVWGQVLSATTYIASNVIGIIGYFKADKVHKTPPVQL